MTVGYSKDMDSKKANQKDSKMNDLIQRLANAMTTASQAMGDDKQSRNDIAADVHRAHLEAEGTAIPSDDELYSIGIFNGPGSV